MAGAGKGLSHAIAEAGARVQESDGKSAAAQKKGRLRTAICSNKAAAQDDTSVVAASQ